MLRMSSTRVGASAGHNRGHDDNAETRSCDRREHGDYGASACRAVKREQHGDSGEENGGEGNERKG
jgi:hypothetical protein